MLSMAYAGLQDIDDVAPLSDLDKECVDELRNVLRKHGKLDRFGITLLHTHFQIAEDEVLIESCDHEGRRLTMSVVPADSVDPSAIVETTWRLTDGAAMTSCVRACVAAGGGHKSKHVTVK